MTPTPDRVIRLIADVLGVPPGSVTPESTADTVPNWDSIGILNLAMALEAAFDVSLTPEDIADLLSVEIILSVLESKGVAVAR